MEDASPVKWHLAHTTWFFETFVLLTRDGARPVDPRYGYLFNSYYEALGARQPRPLRGLITRPSAEEVAAYRAEVDARIEAAIEDLDPAALAVVELGLRHEQQHQELMLTDVLHLLAQNPLEPAYDPSLAPPTRRSEAPPGEARALDFEGGLVWCGADPEAGFAFDNEGPRHQTFLRPFRLADRPVRNGDMIEFIASGGYERPELWLSDGFAARRAGAWSAPLYWREDGGVWSAFTLAGRIPVDPEAPVQHLSFYEADALARWRGARLPTEAEWETAAAGLDPEAGNFADGPLRPLPPTSPGEGPRQMFGDVWEWTASAYQPYPGFRPADGAIGEYNGKFMINQMVLRGGSCLTPRGHVRASYRNFFHPDKRWQASGLRLAWDAPASRVRSLADAHFRSDVLEGLSGRPKRIPSKYFYDGEGSRLFERICELAEYYPTRTEDALLEARAGEIARLIPEEAVLVEFGSGSSSKTRRLLDAAPHLHAYVPIDISPAALRAAAAGLAGDYPRLKIAPVVGDFTQTVQLPAEATGRPRVGFFPGSTIGNFDPPEAQAFLRRARASLGEGAAFLVGVDLVKDPDVLEAAYNDAEGVTRDFNKNLLVRINRELLGDFRLEAFDHLALWNAQESRIEMHLVSREDQTVHVAGRAFRFAAGERIHTENSYKYRPDDFEALAVSAGWRPRSRWRAEPGFGIFLLTAVEPVPV